MMVQQQQRNPFKQSSSSSQQQQQQHKLQRPKQKQQKNMWRLWRRQQQQQPSLLRMMLLLLLLLFCLLHVVAVVVEATTMTRHLNSASASSASASAIASSDSSTVNDQVMYRIRERINEFMSLPQRSCEQLLRFKELHGFIDSTKSVNDLLQKQRNDASTLEVKEEEEYIDIDGTMEGGGGGSMGLYDQRILLQYLYSIAPSMILYFGLEDGTFIYYSDNLMTLDIRQPGNSGYKIMNDSSAEAATSTSTSTSTSASATSTTSTSTITENPTYMKHYQSCIDSTTGENINCMMEVGMQYIQCINDCQLVPCTTTTTTTTTTMLLQQQQNQNPEDNTTITTTTNTTTTTATTAPFDIMMIEEADNDDDDDDIITVMCPQYEIITITDAKDALQRGYIPDTYYCMNQYGLPEQRFGHVLLNYTSQELGNCYYPSSSASSNSSSSSSTSLSSPLLLVNRTGPEGRYTSCGYNSSFISGTNTEIASSTSTSTSGTSDDNSSTNSVNTTTASTDTTTTTPTTTNNTTDGLDRRRRQTIVIEQEDDMSFDTSQIPLWMIDSAQEDDETHNNVCSTVFHGAYDTPEYDPRYRDWYQSTKKNLRPIWTDPYTYAISNEIGITYSQPIYRDVPYYYYENKNDNDLSETSTSSIEKKEGGYQQLQPSLKTRKRGIHRIFEGVIAVDYYLHQINEFIIEQYANTNFKILIVEQKEPHYIIAASAISSQYYNQVTKMVTKENETISCTEQHSHNGIYDADYCIPVRISIVDLLEQQQRKLPKIGSGSGDGGTDNHNSSTIRTLPDDDSPVLQRAFLAHQLLQFPMDYPVNVKESDAIHSPAYSVSVQYYSQQDPTASDDSSTTTTTTTTTTSGNNLNWYIFVFLPMSQSMTDAITVQNQPSLFSLVLLLGCMGFITCGSLLFIFYQKRKEKAVIHSDWRFTCAFILGCTVLNLSTFTLLGPNTNGLCMVRMWTFHGLFVLTLSPLFVKVYRLYQLLQPNYSHQNRNNHEKTIRQKNIRVILLTLPLFLIELLILFVFSLVDPPQQTEHLGVGFGIGVQQVTCEHKTNGFFIVQLLFNACLVFIGCFLAYQTKDLDPKFGEAKQLGFSMYNVAFTGLVIVLIVNLVELEYTSRIVLQAVGVLWGSFFCSFAFVFPRLLEVQKEKQKYKENSKNANSIQSSGSGGLSGHHHQVMKSLQAANGSLQFQSEIVPSNGRSTVSNFNTRSHESALPALEEGPSEAHGMDVVDTEAEKKTEASTSVFPYTWSSASESTNHRNNDEKLTMINEPIKHNMLGIRDVSRDDTNGFCIPASYQEKMSRISIVEDLVATLKASGDYRGSEVEQMECAPRRHDTYKQHKMDRNSKPQHDHQHIRDRPNETFYQPSSRSENGNPIQTHKLRQSSPALHHRDIHQPHRERVNEMVRPISQSCYSEHEPPIENYHPHQTRSHNGPQYPHDPPYIRNGLSEAPHPSSPRRMHSRGEPQPPGQYYPQHKPSNSNPNYRSNETFHPNNAPSNRPLTDNYYQPGNMRDSTPRYNHEQPQHWDHRSNRPMPPQSYPVSHNTGNRSPPRQR